MYLREWSWAWTLVIGGLIGCSTNKVPLVDAGSDDAGLDGGWVDAGADAGVDPTPCTADGGVFAILFYDYTWTTPHALGIGEVGQPYTWHFFAGCGTFPYSYSVSGSLPDGLALSLTGFISGVPSTATDDGGMDFELIAQDSVGHTTQAAFSIMIISGVSGIGGNDGG